MEKKNKVQIGPYTFNERELAQIIRRKMISKSEDNGKNYNRKIKHKNKDGYGD